MLNQFNMKKYIFCINDKNYTKMVIDKNKNWVCGNLYLVK